MSNKTVQNVKIIKREIDGIRLSLSGIILVVFCTFLLILSTFLMLNITHFIIPAGLFHGEKLVLKDFIFTYRFIPQIPVVMFIAAFLGRKYGISSILLYILLGLFVIPVFALGGGLKYIFEYGFGYIAGYIPAAFFAGSILKSGYSNRNIVHAALVGVLTIHIIGIFYMMFIASLKHEDLAFIANWINAQSSIKIIYDFIFSFAAIFLAKYLRIILWFFM